MSERVTEGQGFKKKLNQDVIGGVAVANLDILHVVPSGSYIQARFTPRGELYVAFDNDITVNSGGLVATASPVILPGTTSPLSLATDGDLRTTLTQAQAVDGAAAPAEAVQIGGRVETVTPNPDDNTLTSFSLDSYNGLRVRADRAQGTHGDTAPAEVIMVGQYAESTVPAEVTDGDVVRQWFDLLGRLTLRADDLSSGTLLNTPVSQGPRSITGPLTFTQIDEPGVTVETDISDRSSWCFQIVVGGSPTATTIVAEGSHDNTNWFDLTTDTTAKVGLAVATNIGTISAAGVYEWKGSNFASKYIRLKVMPTSGSPESVTLDVQLMAASN